MERNSAAVYSKYIHQSVLCCAQHVLIWKNLNSTFSLPLDQSKVAIPFSASPSKRCYKAGGTALELPAAMAAQVSSTTKIPLSSGLVLLTHTPLSKNFPCKINSNNKISWRIHGVPQIIHPGLSRKIAGDDYSLFLLLLADFIQGKAQDLLPLELCNPDNCFSIIFTTDISFLRRKIIEMQQEWSHSRVNSVPAQLASTLCQSGTFHT